MQWPSNSSPAKQSELTNPPTLNAPSQGESLPTLGGNASNSTTTLQGPRGINGALFTEKIRDRDDRLDRLEGVVQSLRNDFDTMQPSINRLIGLEGDIQELVGQLEVLLAEENTPAPANIAQAPPTNAPKPQPVMQTAAKAPPQSIQPKPIIEKPTPAASRAKAVTNIRIGEHPDKTRIVLDMNAKSTFTHDLDNQEKILIIDLPSTQWSAMTQKTFTATSPLIQSFRTEISESGSLLIVQLKQTANVAYAKSIGGKTPTQSRIVIDLTLDASMSATQ